MENHVVLNKKPGQTPLKAIQEWKAAHAEYAEVPASVAGRLDPMATGLLLVLLGDECKKKDEYTNLDKEYEVEVLLDIGSDTGDVLGLVTEDDTNTEPNADTLQMVLKNELGTHTHPYPAFSSKTVNGTPLFIYALQGTLDSISIPEHEETFHTIELLSLNSLPLGKLQQRIKEMLAVAPISDEPSKVLGADFRIHAVRNSWQTVFLQPERSYTLLKLRVVCGSGAYMRTLAQRIGASLNTNALALSIHRTRVGPYTIDK
jgi:tRNA pseudouridine(55) synthase